MCVAFSNRVDRRMHPRRAVGAHEEFVRLVVARDFSDVVARLQTIAEKAGADLGDSLTKRVGKNARPPGKSDSGVATKLPVPAD